MRKINVITLGCSKNTVDSEHLMARLAAAGYTVVFDSDRTDAKTVVIKVRYHDFSTQSRNHTLPYPVSNFESLHQAVRQMRDSFPWQDQGIRLLGVGVQNLILPDAEEHSVKQLSLF